MALSFSTGMSLISVADSVTNWAASRFSGSGQAPAAALDTTVTREGTGSIAAKLAGNNWVAALLFDWYASTEGGKSANTTVNLSTAGNEVIAMWVQNTTPGVSLTQAADGMQLLVSSSADSGTTNPTVYSLWTVWGSDVYPGGWQLLMVDTRKTPTSTTGGGADLTAVRRIGFLNRNIASVGQVKADNVYVDAMWYGRPIYQLQGDGTLTADWDDFYQDSLTNQNGLIEKVGGTLILSCGIRFGDTAQSSTTTFVDATGQPVSFKRHTYENGTSVVDALTYTDYYLVDAQGNGATRTDVTIGTVVGTGDDRQGVLGGSIAVEDSANMNFSVDFQTDAADLANIKLYGVTFKGAHEGVLLDDTNGVGEVISCQFVNCGAVDTGSTNNGAEILNSFVIDPDGTTNNYGLSFPQTPGGGTLTHNTKNINFITSGTPTTQYMIEFSDASDYTINVSGYKFFGDFSSGTLWHGINSGLNADITISASNSDPVQAEFSNTNSGTITVNNDVDFDLTNLVAGTTIYAEATSGGSLSVGTVMISAQVIPGTTFSTTLTANQPFKCLLAKHDDEGGATDYEPILFEDTTGSGFSRRIEQIAYP